MLANCPNCGGIVEIHPLKTSTHQCNLQAPNTGEHDDGSETMTATQEQVKAAVNAITALAEAVRELGEVPAGHLYAAAMATMSLETFNSFIDRLQGAKLVERRGDLLVWVGPTVPN